MSVPVWYKIGCVVLCSVQVNSAGATIAHFLESRRQAVDGRVDDSVSTRTVRIALQRLFQGEAPEFGKFDSWLGSTSESMIRTESDDSRASPVDDSRPVHRAAGSMLSLGRAISPIDASVTMAITAIDSESVSSSHKGFFRAQLQPGRHVYIGTMAFGDDSQLVRMLFDTGSGNLVVPSAQSAAELVAPAKLPKAWEGSPPPPLQHHGFDTESGRAKRVSGDDEPTRITYATGKVSGREFEARTCLGGACAEDMRVLLADHVSEDLRQFDFDGVLGLSLPGLGLDGSSSNLVDTLAAAGTLPARVFAINLGDGNGQGPEAMFGGYDSQMIASGEDLRWLPVTDSDRGQWQVPLVGLAVGGGAVVGRRLDVCSGKGANQCSAVVDTGSAQLTAPKDIVQALKHALSPVNCQDTSAMPTLSFSLGDAGAFELDASDYLEFSQIDPSVCRLALGVHDDNDRGVLLGHPFLRRYYAVFDQAVPRIGLARAAR